LAYITYDERNPNNEGLFITDKSGELGEMVLQGRFYNTSSPLMWATNNVILLRQAEGKLVVVQLTRS
jgi:hypothetical protein